MSEIVWESDAQMSGFMVMSNGMVWPDDWPGTLVEAQFTSARGDGADLDRDPDMVPSGPGRVTFTPLVRTVGYYGDHGKRIVSLHPFEAVVGDDGYLYTPDEYGQPGIRGIVLPSNDSAVVDEHDWTWRVTFDIPNTTIRPTHIPTPHDHSVDIKDYLDSDANHGVRVVVDRVAARETLTARDEVIQARDLVLPARDETLTARDQTLAHGITVDTSVGTRVYVGDTMIHGDTGWRDVSTSINQKRLDLSDQNSFAVLRRENTTISLYFRAKSGEDIIGSAQSVSWTILSRLPEGFTIVESLEAAFSVSVNSRNRGGVSVFITGPSLLLGGGDSVTWEEDDVIEAAISWETGTSWPTSLPGVPA